MSSSRAPQALQVGLNVEGEAGTEGTVRVRLTMGFRNARFLATDDPIVWHRTVRRWWNAASHRVIWWTFRRLGGTYATTTRYERALFRIARRLTTALGCTLRVGDTNATRLVRLRVVATDGTACDILTGDGVPTTMLAAALPVLFHVKPMEEIEAVVRFNRRARWMGACFGVALSEKP